MRNVTVLRHVNFEDLGSIEDVFTAYDYAIDYVEVATSHLAEIDPLSPDILVILGGPVGLTDSDDYPFLSQEILLIKQRIASQKPLLGICLGAQLIASALGAAVYPMGQKEIGFATVDITTAGNLSPLRHLSGVPVLHWHGDQFDIPKQATKLASTAVCPNQAFSLGNNLLALQFHPEVKQQNIEKWLIGHACELAQSGISPNELRIAANQFGTSLQKASHALFDEWLNALTEE